MGKLWGLDLLIIGDRRDRFKVGLIELGDEWENSGGELGNVRYFDECKEKWVGLIIVLNGW